MQQVAQGHDDDGHDELQQMAQSLLDHHLEIDQMLTQMFARGLTIEHRRQLIAKYTDIIARLEAQIRALVGDPQPVEPQPATQSQESVTRDPVLEYVQAWDAKKFGDLDRVITLADLNEALNAAFMTIHKVFDPAIPYTEQLLRFRNNGHIGA